MFRAPLCPSSGAWEYYTVGCSLWYLVLGFQVVGMVWSWGLCVRFAGCCFTTPYRQLENQAPNTTGSNHLSNSLELLMTGIKVPETCWASSKICNKNSSIASSWHFISTYFHSLETSEAYILYGKILTSMWPCIVTNLFIIKPTICTNFTYLFCPESLHVSDSLSVLHQEFIHCTLSNGICHTSL
jgi:hypothetical protein